MSRHTRKPLDTIVSSFQSVDVMVPLLSIVFICALVHSEKIPVIETEAQFHSESKNVISILKRSRRAFYTADFQATAEALFLPQSIPDHFVATVTYLIFAIVGFALAGISVKNLESYSTIG